MTFYIQGLYVVNHAGRGSKDRARTSKTGCHFSLFATREFDTHNSLFSLTYSCQPPPYTYRVPKSAIKGGRDGNGNRGVFVQSAIGGDKHSQEPVTVLPVFPGRNGGPVYRTLKEALQQGTLTISEVTDGGSVPELKVINKGDMPVLLLDGEELAGAKQNRVLNTTILLDVNSETTIPVSCTEHGRWSYTSSHFADSDVVMASNVRREKVRSVHENLKNQGALRVRPGSGVGQHQRHVGRRRSPFADRGDEGRLRVERG